MPKVSVIIPTHNRAELVEKAIKSVLAQTYTDHEILVCDDASTDNTPHVMESFKDPRIRYTRYEKNIGVIEVRNNAVMKSTGSYIAFLDDDDEWHPTKLEKQVSVLDDGPDNLGLVYTGVNSIDTSGRIVEITIHRFKGNVLNRLLFNSFVTTSSVVVKKQCFDIVGLFDPEYQSASDNDMWIRIAEIFEFDYVGEPLINYLITQISISRNYINVTKGLERLIAKHNRLYVVRNRAYSNYLLKLGVAYCFTGNMNDGRKAFIKAVQLSPSDIRLYYNIIISLLGTKAFIKLKETKKLLSTL